MILYIYGEGSIPAMSHSIQHNIVIIILPSGLEILDWCETEYSHVSWAGEVLFSLGWQSPRDGCRDKNTGVSATLKYTTVKFVYNGHFWNH